MGNGRTDFSQIREIGKLEAMLSADKPVAAKAISSAPKISKAPPPINPLKGASAPMDNLVDSNGNFSGTYAQFKALEKAGKI